jgi:4-amino-4-deoxy-L-arabinose transferase-like glycosyltransferase
VLWGFWLLTMGAFFSLDGSFHQYYMVVMVPGLSALVGIGVAIMWQDYRSTSWRGWLLPLAFLVTSATQVYILKGYPVWSHRLSHLIEGFTALGVLALILFRLLPRLRLHISAIRVASIATGIGLFTLLVAPTVWASYSVFQNTASAFPGAGPRYNDTTGKFFGSGQPVVQNGLPQSYTPLISYLEANQGKTKFLVATINSGTSSPIVLATNKPVMALGGYSGNDPILTTAKLQILIHNGTIRYFLLNLPRSIQRAIDELPKQYRDRFRGGNFGQQGALTAWVSTHCSTIPARDWTVTGRASNTQLYDCAISM